MTTLSTPLPTADPGPLACLASVRPACEAPHLDIDEPALCDWLAEAMPGESIRYYRGFLGYDRAPSTGILPECERKRLVAVARRAMQAAEDGRLHLLQRRHDDGDYSYLAVKAPERH